MPEVNDMELVRDYADRNSEAAFAELVGRHINLVYSAAYRFTGNREDAKDVTQAVFIILAQKAASLCQRAFLIGWLYETTRFTAMSFLRSKSRRAAREQEASMQSTLNSSGSENVWRQLAPLLEEAMARLSEKERALVALRFFENKTSAETATVLGIKEWAAHKRTARAVEKLRLFFTKRGVIITTAVLTAAIAANSVQAAPPELAKSVTAAAMVKGASAGGSTLKLTKGALKLMAWTKVKTAVVVAVGTILAMSTATVVVKWSFFPVIKDSYFQANYRNFQSLPGGLFVLRPTHFQTQTNSFDYSGEGTSKSGEHVTRMMGRNRTFKQLIARIYSCRQAYIVFPEAIPKDHFDYLSTVMDSHTQEHFEAAIQKKLGYVASWQEREIEVMLLKVIPSSLVTMKPANPSERPSIRWDSPNHSELQRQPMWNLANELETSANIPVTDQTGLTNFFDFALECSREDLTNRNWTNVNEALARLGLELVPTNIPTKMVVVQMVKH